MVFIFIKSTNALAINQETFQFLPLMVCIQELGPAPETFGAWIDGWSNAKPLFLSCVDDDSIKEEGFARPILASNSYDPHSLLDAR